MALCTDDICIQPQALDLLKQIDVGAACLLTRSVEMARQRQSPSVVPQDVREALEAMLAEIAAAFVAADNGTFLDIEFSEDDFRRIAALPFRHPDLPNDADDDL